MLTEPSPSIDSAAQFSVEDSELLERKRFLIRLISALHISGNYGFRTEKYCNRVGAVFGLYAKCLIYPSSAIVSFQNEKYLLTPNASESYTVDLSFNWDLYKLDKLLDLVYHIRRGGLDFDAANDILKEIEDQSGLYPWYVIFLCYGIASFSSSVMFFGGTWFDGFFGLLFGWIVYAFDVYSPRLRGLTQIQCFLNSAIVSILSSLVCFYGGDRFCLLSQLFGGVVWLLPGVGLTMSILEIFANMANYGGARLIIAITTATQIGFGLTLGYRIVYENSKVPDSFINGCQNPVDPAFSVLLTPLAIISFGIILNAHCGVFFEMVLTAFVSNIVMYVMGYYRCPEDMVPLVCSIAVTATARVYSYASGKKNYIVALLGGLLFLVPGSVGVRGSFNMWSGNADIGIAFTYKMVMIGVSLSVGIFLSVIPTKKWLPFRLKGSLKKDKNIGFKMVNPVIEMRRNSLS